jgi:hypothetical protein
VSCPLHRVVVKGRRNAQNDQPAVLCAARDLKPGTRWDISGRNSKIGQTVGVCFPEQSRSGPTIDNPNTALKRYTQSATKESKNAKLGTHFGSGVRDQVTNCQPASACIDRRRRKDGDGRNLGLDSKQAILVRITNVKHEFGFAGFDYLPS